MGALMAMLLDTNDLLGILCPLCLAELIEKHQALRSLRNLRLGLVKRALLAASVMCVSMARPTPPFYSADCTAIGPTPSLSLVLSLPMLCTNAAPTMLSSFVLLVLTATTRDASPRASIFAVLSIAPSMEE